MRRYFLMYFLAALCVKAVSSGAAEAPRAVMDGKRIILENEFLRLSIDPEHGGRVASFVDKRDGEERVEPGRVEGLCFDQFYEQDDLILSGTSLAGAKPYEGKILNSGPRLASVLVGRMSIPWERNVYNANYDSLNIEKIFTLESGSPVLRIDIRIHNRSPEGRRPAYWFRSGYVLGKGRENERYYRPSREGVKTGGPDDPLTDQMVWNPAYGWTATADTTVHRGVVWLMDASRLMMFYNCISAITGRHIEEFSNKYGVDPLWIWDNASSSAVTAEWYYRPAFIPSGGVWQTTVHMISLEKIDAVDYAGEHFVTDVKTPPAETEGPISLTLWRALHPARNLTITGSLFDLDTGSRPVSCGVARLRELEFEPQVVSLPTGVKMPSHVLFRFRVSGLDSRGKQFEEEFEHLYSSDGKVLTTIASPKMTFDYHPGAVGLKTEGKRRVLFLEGLAFDRWGLIKALEGMGATVRESEFMKKRITTAVKYFPATLGEALRYDLIIMAAMDAHALGYDGCMILRDYVNNGGSLLILGGLYSWGGGEFREMGLDGFLPLSVQNTFDLTKGENYRIKTDKNLLKEMLGTSSADSSEWGVVYWFHHLTVKPGAQVLVQLDDSPLAAVSEYGRGRIACVAGTTLGPKNEGSHPFWQSPGWISARDGLLRWLLK